MAKRLFDVFFSALGLLLLSPVFLVTAGLIRWDSPGPVFFRQERIGKGFESFRIYKFRTMVADARDRGPEITAGGDARITRVGGFLRRWKLDELPQLINVLRGQMSLVGPRPEVRRYVELFREEYGRVLRARPGITDPASLCFAREERLLAASRDWERDYVEKILPEKIRLSADYAQGRTMVRDLGIILRTIFGI